LLNLIIVVVRQVVGPNLEVGIDQHQQKGDEIHNHRLLVGVVGHLAEAGPLVDADPHLKSGSHHLQDDVGRHHLANGGLLHQSVDPLEGVVLAPKGSHLLKKGGNHLRGSYLVWFGSLGISSLSDSCLDVTICCICIVVQTCVHLSCYSGHDM